MSQYKKIKVEYKNAESLAKALAAVFGQDGFQRSANGRDNIITLRNEWRHGDDACAFVVSRHSVNQTGVHSYGGLGFKWNGSGFDLIADDLDSYERGGQSKLTPILSRIKQEYSLAELTRQARMKGLSVKTDRQQDGTIKVKLAQL